MNLLENWVKNNIEDAAKILVHGCPSMVGMIDRKVCGTNDDCAKCWEEAIEGDKKIDKAVEKAGEKLERKHD